MKATPAGRWSRRSTRMNPTEAGSEVRRCRRLLQHGAGALVLLVAVLATSGCHAERRPASPQPACATASASRTPAIHFTDVTERAGIRFRHANGGFGRKYLPETMGSGCAFLDFDGDGWLDILLLNGRPLGETGRRGDGETGRPGGVKDGFASG